MPQPIWISIILLAYGCLTFFVFLLAAIIRIFEITPRKVRVVKNVRSFTDLRKLFIKAALVLFIFSLIFPPLSSIEQLSGETISNFIAFVFFLELTSSIYMVALWFLASSLDKNLEDKCCEAGQNHSVQT